MSHTTEPAIDPEEQKSIVFSDDALVKNVPRRPRLLPPKYPIDLLMQTWAIQNMSRVILNMSRKRVENRLTRKAIVQKAKQVLDRIPECNDAEDVEFLSNEARDIWPLLASSISTTMFSMGDVISIIVHEANHDSATQRWSSMKADPTLKSSLANINPATSSNYDILRLFLSILIGYWGDIAELPKLDAATGKRHAFGCMIKLWENVYGKKERKPPPEEPVKTTEPAIDPEEQKSIVFSDDALVKNVPRRPRLPPPKSPISLLMQTLAIQNMSRVIQNMSRKRRKRVENRVTRKAIIQKAKQVLDRIRECNDAEGIEFLSNEAREIWPLLASSISKTMFYVGNIIGVIVLEANHDSATQRWASMKADPTLESSLANIKPATSSNYDILRLFLSILIGYWGDKAELPKLDAAIGKRGAFAYVIKLWEKLYGEKEGNPHPEELVEKFSC